MTKQITETKLTYGSTIYVSLGGAAMGTAVCVSGLHLFVVAETEKAVQVKAYGEDGRLRDRTCWLPRKALVLKRAETDRRFPDTYTLAHWFRPDGYAANFIERSQIVGGVSL